MAERLRWCCEAVGRRQPVSKMVKTHRIFAGLPAIGDRACSIRRESAQPTVPNSQHVLVMSCGRQGLSYALNVGPGRGEGLA
jgi:hypothetical protein